MCLDSFATLGGNEPLPTPVNAGPRLSPLGCSILIQILQYGQGACRAFTDSVAMLPGHDAARWVLQGRRRGRAVPDFSNVVCLLCVPQPRLLTCAPSANRSPLFILPLFDSYLCPRAPPRPFHTRRAAADPSGSRCLEALLHGNAPPKVKARLLAALKGTFGAVAGSAPGSYLVEAAYNTGVSDGDK